MCLERLGVPVCGVKNLLGCYSALLMKTELFGNYLCWAYKKICKPNIEMLSIRYCILSIFSNIKYAEYGIFCQFFYKFIR